MDNDHDLIVSAQMLGIIEKQERNTITGIAGLPVAIKDHLKSHGWLSKKDADELRMKNEKLKDALKRISYYNRNRGEEGTFALPQNIIIEIKQIAQNALDGKE